MDYKQKYFKYKNKYLKLKNQEINYNFVGGSNLSSNNSQSSQDSEYSEHNQESPKWKDVLEGTNFSCKNENDDKDTNDKNTIEKYNNDIFLYNIAILHTTQTKGYNEEPLKNIKDALWLQNNDTKQKALDIAIKKQNICWSKNKNPKYKIYDKVVQLLS